MEILFSGNAAYLGGHLKFSEEKNVSITITKKEIILRPRTLFGRKDEIYFKIPIKKILLDEIGSQKDSKEFQSDQMRKATAMYAGGHGAIGGLAVLASFAKIVTVPFSDKNGIKQYPRFNFGIGSTGKKFSSALYSVLVKSQKKK